MISVLVPPLLMILGFSYAVHVTSEYHQQRRNPESSDPVILQTLKHMTLPVMLTVVSGRIRLFDASISVISAISDVPSVGKRPTRVLVGT